MSDSEVVGMFIVVFFLSITHTFGEAIYKSGSMILIKKKESLEHGISKVRPIFLPLLIVGFSIALSLGVKIIYGIILGSNPLSIIGGLFFGLIAIFSVIFGKLIFNEEVSRFKILGIVFIALGIVLLV